MKSLALDHVSVSFGAVHALRDVSIDLTSGEVVMLVGPNGAGKSTLVRVLLGLVRPNKATIQVDGAPCQSQNDLKRRIGYLPEAVAFSDNLRGRQVLRFFCRARGVPTKRADEVLERVGLGHAGNRAVRGYSRGMKQRLGLAVAIVSDPELLVLDEPAGGLDSEGLTVLWSILKEWQDRGKMVLMASHQLALMERRVDRLAVFKQGNVIATGSPHKLRLSTGLQQSVHIQLTPDSNCTEPFLNDLKKWQTCRDTDDDRLVSVKLDLDELLPFMEVAAKHPNAIANLRVEEPTLDDVYGYLQEEAAC